MAWWNQYSQLIKNSLVLQDLSTGLTPLTEDIERSRRIDSYGRYVSANKDVVYDQQYANRIIRDIEDCNGNGRLSSNLWIYFVVTAFTSLYHIL